MLSMSQVRSWSWIVVPILTAFAAACVEDQPAEPTVTDVSLAKGGGGGGPAVDDTEPPGAPQGKTLDVRVFGSRFDQGSRAAFTLDGIPGKVHTNSTRFVNRSELVSNITIDLDADITLYDVEVTTSKGKKGVGADLFKVVEKGTEVYTAIDLRSLTGRGKASQSTNGSAHDITEPDADGVLRVVGGSEEWRTGGTQPVVWTGTLSTIADAEPEALALRGYAAGISDDGTVIAGRVKHTSSGPATPAVWLGPDWTQIDLELPAGFIAGHARDVNNSGVIVGATKNGVDTLATTWASPSAAAVHGAQHEGGAVAARRQLVHPAPGGPTGGEFRLPHRRRRGRYGACSGPGAARRPASHLDGGRDRLLVRVRNGRDWGWLGGGCPACRGRLDSRRQR